MNRTFTLRRALVVKLGGSLWRSPNLGLWIAALQKASMPVTLVPGGGPFADAVRATQSSKGFSDVAGHKMAMLGMEQYGLALVDKFAGLDLASTPDEASAVHARGKIALWRPSSMAIAANVDASWNVTSDSLAAFYAHASGSAALVMIKSVDVETAPDLQGLVDPCFASYAWGLDVFVAGPKALETAPQIFAQGGVAGVRVDFTLSPRKIAS